MAMTTIIKDVIKKKPDNKGVESHIIRLNHDPVKINTTTCT